MCRMFLMETRCHWEAEDGTQLGEIYRTDIENVASIEFG